MRIHNKIFSFILLSAALGSACTKEKGLSPNYQEYISPDVPVTVQNQVDNRPDPTVTTSLAGGGNIQIILNIPSTSGRTIKQITKIATSGSYAIITGSGTTGFYNVPPIAGSGTTITFNTSITEYLANNPTIKPNSIVANAELTQRYYFLITLDNNAVLFPTPVRVLVLP